MPELLTPELANLRDVVDKFAADVLRPLAEDESLDAAERRARVVAASKEIGLFPLTQPKAFVGEEADMLTLTVVLPCSRGRWVTPTSFQR